MNSQGIGNVRESQNVVEAALGMANSQIVQVENRSADIKEAAGANSPCAALDAAVFAFKKSYAERVL